jgi:hypothetical protein
MRVRHRIGRSDSPGIDRQPVDARERASVTAPVFLRFWWSIRNSPHERQSRTTVSRREPII